MFYFDTSFLPPLVLEEKSSRKIEAYVTTLPAGDLYLSHWTRLEFSSLVAREVLEGKLLAYREDRAATGRSCTLRTIASGHQ